MLKFSISLILLTLSNLSFGYTFQKCSDAQVDLLIEASDHALMYADAVLAEDDVTPFIKWMGFNEPATVKFMFKVIREKLLDKNIHYSCDCNDGKYAISLVGVSMFMPEDYYITVCHSFWTAKLDGINSKAGTIIHELSHFMTIGATEDVFYSPRECAKQAKLREGQSLVIMNADSYEYLAEDIASKYIGVSLPKNNGQAHYQALLSP